MDHFSLRESPSLFGHSGIVRKSWHKISGWWASFNQSSWVTYGSVARCPLMRAWGHRQAELGGFLKLIWRMVWPFDAFSWFFLFLAIFVRHLWCLSLVLHKIFKKTQSIRKSRSIGMHCTFMIGILHGIGCCGRFRSRTLSWPFCRGGPVAIGPINHPLISWMIIPSFTIIHNPKMLVGLRGNPLHIICCSACWKMANIPWFAGFVMSWWPSNPPIFVCRQMESWKTPSD